MRFSTCKPAAGLGRPLGGQWGERARCGAVRSDAVQRPPVEVWRSRQPRAAPTVQSNLASLTGTKVQSCPSFADLVTSWSPCLALLLHHSAICSTNRQPTTWPPLRARSKRCPICPLFVPCRPACVTSSLTAHLNSHLPVLPRPTCLDLFVGPTSTILHSRLARYLPSLPSQERIRKPPPPLPTVTFVLARSWPRVNLVALLVRLPPSCLRQTHVPSSLQPARAHLWPPRRRVFLSNDHTYFATSGRLSVDVRTVASPLVCRQRAS